MSQWIEVSIQTTHEAADLVAEIMRAAGANNGVVIEDPVLINTLRNSGTWELCDIPEQENTEVVTITAYYPEDEELQPRLTQIDEDLIWKRVLVNVALVIRVFVLFPSRIGLTNGNSISMLRILAEHW